VLAIIFIFCLRQNGLRGSLQLTYVTIFVDRSGDPNNTSTRSSVCNM